MLCFSDYILSKSPWTYCRLNEPVGYDLYNDLTGNKNHLYSKIVDGEYVAAANNQNDSTFVGDPDLKAIRPLDSNRTWGVNEIPVIPDTALCFRVPEFKSENWIYRNSVRIQNAISPLPMWIDFQWDPQPEAIIAPLKDLLPVGLMATGQNSYLNRVIFDDDFDYTSAYDGAYLTENFISTTVLGRIYEPFLYFGSLVLLSETTVRVNLDGTLGTGVKLKVMCQHTDGWIEMWSRTIVSLNPSVDPADPFASGMHRFVMGIEQPSVDTAHFKLSIDGAAITTTTFSGVTFLLQNYSSYSNIACLNKTAFSNLSIFFRTPYPSQEWVDGSQETLESAYRAAHSDIPVKLTEYPSITKHAGSVINLLDRILFIGNLQEPVLSLSRSGESVRLQITNSVIPSVGSSVLVGGNHKSVYDGCWQVSGITQTTVTLIPTSISCEDVIRFNSTDYLTTGITIISTTTLTVNLKPNHKFRINDIVTLGFTSDSLTHTWTVASTGTGLFTVNAVNSPATMTFSGGCIIKKMPVGGGSGWTRSYTTDDLVGYTPTIFNASARKILVDNSTPSLAIVYLAALDNTNRSDPVYFTSYIKNTINLTPDLIPWKVIGDRSRLYLMIPSKQNIASHTQVLCLGEIQNWMTDGWQVVILGYKDDDLDQNCGFNFAFLYPRWSILPTGVFLCQSEIGSARSDGRWRIDENGAITNFLGYYDAGHHMYPIPAPYRAIL